MKPVDILIGKCIYCGSCENLTDEHIIPKGLGGVDILREASCLECNKITSAFELDVLRKMLIQVRTTLGISTRRPKERPTSFPLIFTKNNEEFGLELPPNEVPTLLVLPIFPEPQHISKNQIINQYPINHWLVQVAGPDIMELGEKLEAEKIRLEFKIPPASFLRMISKIGYGYLIAKYGLPKLDSVFVLPAIRNDIDEIGKWSGNLIKEFTPKGDTANPHEVKILFENEEKEIGVAVRLFAQHGAPEYLVIIKKA